MVICKIIIQSLLLALLWVAAAAPQPLLGMPKHQGMLQRSPWHGLSQSRSVMLWCGDGSHGDAGWQRVAQATGQCPPRAPMSLRAAAVPLLRKCCCSGVLHPDPDLLPPGGGRASHGAFPTMNRHRYSFFPQPRPGQCSGAGAGGEVFLGVALQHLLLNQHHVPDCVCGNHQTLTGAACSHRNTGTEGNN